MIVFNILLVYILFEIKFMARTKDNPKKNKEDNSSADNDNTDDSSDEKCICGKWIKDAVWIGCDGCQQWYHVKCVKLSGLTSGMVDKIDEYICPCCFTFPEDVVAINMAKTQLQQKDQSPEKDTCNTIRIMVQQELHKITDMVKTDIKDAVEKAMKADAVVKTYASVTAESERKILQQVSELKPYQTMMETVMDESIRKLDSDHVQRARRVTNVVVKMVPESTKTTPTDRQQDDLNFAVDDLKIPESDIVATYRGGVQKNVGDKDSMGNVIKKVRPRPLIIKLKSKDKADYWHEHGRGLKTDAEYFDEDKGENCKYYINQDLCLTDRKAFFMARQERKRRTEQRSNLTS